MGSNLGDRELHIRNGIDALSRSISVGAVSSLYESEPHGKADQPWFLNLALRGGTRLSPHALLEFAKAIERAQGREEGGARWGPRPIDIDIILFGQQVIRTPDLTVPHASMALRRFCLLPVSEIAADFAVPPEGFTVRELLDRCKDPLEVHPL